MRILRLLDPNRGLRGMFSPAYASHRARRVSKRFLNVDYPAPGRMTFYALNAHFEFEGDGTVTVLLPRDLREDLSLPIPREQERRLLDRTRRPSGAELAEHRHQTRLNALLRHPRPLSSRTLLLPGKEAFSLQVDLGIGLVEFFDCPPTAMAPPSIRDGIAAGPLHVPSSEGT